MARMAVSFRPLPVITSVQLHPMDRWLACRLAETIAPARIRLELWNGWASPSVESPIGVLVVRDRRALIGLIVDPDLYFGECYMSQRVEILGDLEGVMRGLSGLRRPSQPSWRQKFALWATPSNGFVSARRNVHHHYDLGNDFYATWLDPELVYTCAYYPRRDASLEEAQATKLDLVCRKLRLRPGERVVEAGCGWGALSLHMARHYGVGVTAFNISHEQIQYARGRASREGLDGRVTFVEDDYRNITGQFDAFVSVGMLEHVGRRNYMALGRVLRRSLRPDTGRGLLHFIGRDHPRLLNAWIRRRIFPGAYPPTIAEVMASVLEPADLSVIDVENLRLHYARTLEHWRGRFEAAHDAVRQRFGEAFYRAWRLYLAGSEAAFATGWMQLFQVVFAPAGGRVADLGRPARRPRSAPTV